MDKKYLVDLEDYGNTADYLAQCEEAIDRLTKGNWAVALLVAECIKLAETKRDLLQRLNMKENDAMGEYIKMKQAKGTY